MRRSSPMRYSVSTVSSVRQTMRAGGYIAGLYPASPSVRQPDRTAEFGGRAVARRDRGGERCRDQPEWRIHRHGKSHAPVGVGPCRGFAEKYLALGIAGIGIGIKFDHG